EIDEESLVRLDVGIAANRDCDEGPVVMTGGEVQRSGAAAVIAAGRGRAVGRGVLNGDGHVAPRRQMHEEGETLRATLTLRDRGIVNEDGRGRCVLRHSEEFSGDTQAAGAWRAS